MTKQRTSSLRHRTRLRPQIGRRLFCEKLENRKLLAGDAFHLDVNLDGSVTPRDALKVINEIGKHGFRPISGTSDDAMDVNRDQNISAIDALIVINHLGRQFQLNDMNHVVLDSSELNFGASELPETELVNNAEDLGEILENPPDIDFSKETVVVYARGAFPSTGYGIDLVRVEQPEDSSAATVTLRLNEPASEVSVLTVITNPRIVLKLDAVIDQITFLDSEGNVLGTATS